MTDIMVKLKTALLISGAAATFAACTPQQVAQTIRDYAATRTQRDAQHAPEATTAAPGDYTPPAPTLISQGALDAAHADVVVTCTTMEFHGAGFAPSTPVRIAYGAQPPLGFTSDAAGHLDGIVTQQADGQGILFSFGIDQDAADFHLFGQIHGCQNDNPSPTPSPTNV